MTMKEIINAMETKIAEQRTRYNDYVKTQPIIKIERDEMDEQMKAVICGVHAMEDFLRVVKMNGYEEAMDK